MGNKESIVKLEGDMKHLYELTRETEKRQQENTINFGHMVDKLDDFLNAFKHHDEEEMKKYDEISKELKNTNIRLSKIESSMGPMQDELAKSAKVRAKVYKWSIVGSTAFFLIGAIATAIIWVLDFTAKLDNSNLLKPKVAYTDKQKKDYYNNLINNSSVVSDLQKQIEELKKK